MANDYDRIFKENIEELILPLAEKVLGIHFPNIEEIGDDLQDTVERKPDFLKLVKHENNNLDYILHIEFQSTDEERMEYRMLEYYSILLRKYAIDVKQYVFYVGTEEPKKMIPFIKTYNLDFRYEIISIQDFSYDTFLNSDKPEEIIMAILGNFKNIAPETIVQQIIIKLYELIGQGLRLEKYEKQLEILSKLRKLQPITLKILENMAFVYDLETDIRFQQGVEIGEERGEMRGEMKGIEKGIEKLLLAGSFTVEYIAEIYDVSVNYIKKIQEKVKNQKTA
jgi:predicted transposase/invertase (TIGR01784 family)